MAYNQQYRTRVIEYLHEGNTHNEAFDVFKAGTATIARWLLEYRKTGVIGGGYTEPIRRSPRKMEAEKLATYMKAHPDAFLREIAQEFSCSIGSCTQGFRTQ